MHINKTLFTFTCLIKLFFHYSIFHYAYGEKKNSNHFSSSKKRFFLAFVRFNEIWEREKSWKHENPIKEFLIFISPNFWDRIYVKLWWTFMIFEVCEIFHDILKKKWNKKLLARNFSLQREIKEFNICQYSPQTPHFLYISLSSRKNSNLSRFLSTHKYEILREGAHAWNGV